MIGIILIYFIGKSFYALAVEHDKNKWLYAILGIVSYYAGTFLGGMIIAIVVELYSPGTIDSMNEMLLGIMALPIGLLICYLFHFILKRNWGTRQDEHKGPGNPDILDEKI